MPNRKRKHAAILTLVAMLTVSVANAATNLTMLIDSAPNVVSGSEAVIKAYCKKYPDVSIDLEIRPGGSEGDNIVKTRLATGEMCDIFIYNSGSLMLALNPARNLADLTDMPAQDRIDDNFKKVVSHDGKIYGIPLGTTRGGGIFYNRRIYRDLGLEVPKTWDQFMANCQKIKDAGVAAPVAQTYRETWTSQLFVLADFYNVQAQVPDFAERYTANQAKYATTPAAMKGFERLKAVHDAGFLNADYGAANYPDGLYMLATGEAAHYPMLSFAIGALNVEFPDEVKTDIGFFAQPGDDPNDNGLTVWMPDSLYIYAGSEKIEEAKKFLDFVASIEGSEYYLSVNSAEGPPLIKGVELPEGTPPAVIHMLPYFRSGKTAPALEFLSPVKGPSLEQITVEVGSGMREPAAAAAMYDEDVRKQAKQMNLPGW